MTPESDKQLRADYPLVFSRPLMNDEPIRCGEGWFELLVRTCAALDVLIGVLPETEQPEYYAQQVKEKFGALRFNMSKQTPEMTTVIQFAEDASNEICDVCGSQKRVAKRSGDGVERPMLIRTRCDAHVNWFEPETGFAHKTK